MSKSRVRQVGACLLVFSLMIAAVPPTVVADDPTPNTDSGTYGFEDGTTQGWGTYTLTDGALSVDQQNPINGSYSVHVEDTGSGGANAFLHTQKQSYGTWQADFTVNSTYTDVLDTWASVWFGGTGQPNDDKLSTNQYYGFQIGNAGGNDAPTMRWTDGSGNAVSSKNIDLPRNEDMRLSVSVTNATDATATVTYADNGTTYAQLNHTYTNNDPTGEVLIGMKSGGGAVPDMYIDDLTFEGDEVNDANNQEGEGRPIADSPQFDVNADGTIAEKHDLLNDTDNFVKVVDADVQNVDESTGEWSSAGAGGIYNHTDSNGDVNWYMTLRQRTPQDGTSDERGKNFEVWTNPGQIREQSEWSQVFEIYMKDKVQSVEGSVIREYNDTWYFYFSYDDPGATANFDWITAYVTADTVAGLEAKLNDTSTWNDLTGNGVGGTDASSGFQTDGDGTYFEKDPVVMRWGGDYYMMTGQVGGSAEDQYLYRSDTPDFSNPEYLGNPAAPIQNQRSSTDTINTGAITYDEDTNKFIYWTNQFNSSTDKVDWVWTTSTNLRDWNMADARAVANNTNGFSAPRYPDYALAGVDGGAGIFMLENDPNNDSVSNLYIWDYAPSLQTTIAEYTVNGTVTDDTGTALDGASVEIVQNGTVVNSTTTAADGTYSMTVEKGEYDITASKSGFSSQTKVKNVTSNTVVDFTLGATELTGFVTDGQDGSAIEGATVEAVNTASGETYTTTTDSGGGYSLGLVDGETYDVTFSASGYSSTTKSVTMNGAQSLDAGLTPNAVPYIESANPTNSELVDSRTVTLNATVIDPEGSNVTAYFYVLNATGVYTLRGSDTVPSGGTAEITGVQAEPGENAWYVRMEDASGNSDTSPAFLFKTPGNVEIYDATTATDPGNYTLTGKTVTAQIVSLDSDFSKEVTVTDGTVALDGLPDETLTMTITATNRTTQKLVVDDLSAAYHVLLYDDAGAYTQGFTLEDNTGDFPPGDSYVIMQQRYAGAWRTVAADYFGGINLAQLNLQDGTEYRIEVHNSQGDMRQLGGFTGDSANEGTPRQLVINDPTQNIDVQRGARYKWSAYAKNSSGAYSLTLNVEILLNDSTDVTQFDNVTVVMYERGNENNTIYSSNLGVQENFSVSQVLSKDQYENKTWVVKWNATLGDTEVGGSKIVGANQNKVPVPFSSHYKGVIGIMMMLFTGSLFTRVNAAFGALLTSLVTALLWYVGFMPAAVSGGVIVLTVAMGGLFVAHERGNPAT